MHDARLAPMRPTRSCLRAASVYSAPRSIFARRAARSMRRRIAHVEAASLRKLRQRLGDVEGNRSRGGQTRCRHAAIAELQRADRLRRRWSARTRSSLPAPGTGHRRACNRPRPRHAARSTCAKPPAFRPSRACAVAAVDAAAHRRQHDGGFLRGRDRRRSRARAPAPRPSAARLRARAPAECAAAATAATTTLKATARDASIWHRELDARTAPPGSAPPALPRRTCRRGSCTAHR